jgi:hypothetical protein
MCLLRQRCRHRTVRAGQGGADPGRGRRRPALRAAAGEGRAQVRHHGRHRRSRD